MKKYLQDLAYKWLKKTDYHFPLPVVETLIQPENLKRYHAQRIVPYRENLYYENMEGEYIKTFRFDIANELLNEIIIKEEEVPEGVKLSCDLLFQCI